MHTAACIYMCEIGVIFLSLCMCENRMYRRTSNMAGLTYPPTALTALKVKSTLPLPECGFFLSCVQLREEKKIMVTIRESVMPTATVDRKWM